MPREFAPQREEQYKEVCLHLARKCVRSSRYERWPVLRRREYVCLSCGEKLPATYEGQIDELEVWLTPKLEREILARLKERILKLF